MNNLADLIKYIYKEETTFFQRVKQAAKDIQLPEVIQQITECFSPSMRYGEEYASGKSYSFPIAGGRIEALLSPESLELRLPRTSHPLKAFSGKEVSDFYKQIDNAEREESERPLPF